MRVTVQELRAGVSGLQHHDAAIATMRRRLEMKEPGVGPQVLLGRLLLAAGETVEAGRIATQLTQTSPDYGPAWALFGRRLYCGGPQRTCRGCLSQLQYRAVTQSRPPFIGLARIALLNQDGVAADAFAVQAIEGGIDGGPQPDILRCGHFWRSARCDPAG